MFLLMGMFIIFNNQVNIVQFKIQECNFEYELRYKILYFRVKVCICCNYVLDGV